MHTKYEVFPEKLDDLYLIYQFLYAFVFILCY